MSTEYRRGIPSTAHVEAATRLGLLWEDTIRMPLTGPFLLTQTLPNSSFRPIRPDGTPVDWEVLDQEVARVEQPVTVTPTTSATQPLSQPEGFRADLFRRIASHFDLVIRDVVGDFVARIVSVRGLVDVNAVGIHANDYQWGWGTASTPVPGPVRTDILARWTVYQELKPLYDLVDGAQGEAAMPRDVEAEWYRAAQRPTQPVDNWLLVRDSTGLMIKNNMATWRPDEAWHGTPLRNFAAVLDAVAERRVSERMRGQTQAPTVTPAQPEPRRFADVRPDQHGWRWWRDLTTGDCFTIREGVYVRRFDVIDPWLVLDLSAWLDRTVIPTDEQGNPVSWEAAGFAAEAMRPAQEAVQRAANDATPSRSVGVGVDTAKAPITTPLPLPRFTADELDDVDHSKTTKLGEVTLRRGKLPTVEQITKYREVRARRTGGTVADALKESRIDCEVAQYVLERWAGGLGDEESRVLIETASRFGAEHKVGTHLPAFAVDSRTRWYTQNNQTEAEERRQRLAELRQRLAAGATQPQEMAKESEVSRFDLIEPDPQADPVASIRAWEARQAAAKVRPVAVPTRPVAAPHRPAIDVVDAEVDGLSRSEAFTALFGRALNGGC